MNILNISPYYLEKMVLTTEPTLQHECYIAIIQPQNTQNIFF